MNVEKRSPGESVKIKSHNVAPYKKKKIYSIFINTDTKNEMNDHQKFIPICFAVIWKCRYLKKKISEQFCPQT